MNDLDDVLNFLVTEVHANSTENASTTIVRATPHGSDETKVTVLTISVAHVKAVSGE